MPEVESGKIELLTWSIPPLTIMLLGSVAWIGSHDLDPAKPLASKEEPLDVQVVSLDWKWLFIYPGQNVASVNRLVVPAGVPVRFTLCTARALYAWEVNAAPLPLLCRTGPSQGLLPPIIAAPSNPPPEVRHDRDQLAGRRSVLRELQL